MPGMGLDDGRPTYEEDTRRTSHIRMGESVIFLRFFMMNVSFITIVISFGFSGIKVLVLLARTGRRNLDHLIDAHLQLNSN